MPGFLLSIQRNMGYKVLPLFFLPLEKLEIIIGPSSVFL